MARSRRQSSAITPASRTSAGSYVILAALLSLFILLVLANSFLCDDAFISFRYAKNFAAGHGLVFNPGERVEGFTNFFWVILLSGAIAAGGTPEFWSRALALIFSLGTLVYLFLAVRRQSKPAPSRVLPPLLLAICGPFLIWTSGGLETAAFTFFVTVGVISLLGATEQSASRPYVVASLALAAAAITRPEGNMIFALSAAWLIWLSIRKKMDWSRLTYFVVPFALLGAVFFLWRLNYYGKLFPNTFYVKAPGFALLGPGVQYFLRFLWESWIWVPAGLAVYIALRTRRFRWDASQQFLAALLAIFTVYVITTGGDFMALGRFFVPILPLAMLFFYRLSWAQGGTLSGRTIPAIVLVAVLLFGAGNAYTTYRANQVWSTGTVDSIGQLAKYYRDWSRVGKLIRQNAATTDSLATSAAGCIPYYSELYTIDILGLVAPDLSQFRVRENVVRPGHSMILKPEALLALHPQFYVGHPWVVDTLTAVFPLSGYESAGEQLSAQYYTASLELGTQSGPYWNFWVRRDIAQRIPQRMLIHE